MLPYFKKYTVLTCLCAIALPVIVSTIWPMVTGQMMASTITGLLLLFILFFSGLFLGFGFFERRADAKVDALISIYNDDCNPDKFIDESNWLAKEMKMPFNAASSWFVGYYAQALLDKGFVIEARQFMDSIRESMRASTKLPMKVGILVNLVPLVEKVEGREASSKLVDEGLEMLKGNTSGKLQAYAQFLDSQKKIDAALLSGDPTQMQKMSQMVQDNTHYPKRVRVEFAFENASAQYKLGNTDGEKEALNFVIDNGGTLALVKKAKDRLRSISK